ncbi:MAG TPA: hypothetical protein VLZ07_00580 [Syntrophales bacterium]|nr:hypothetical protein [Syntrophales bacterium]
MERTISAAGQESGCHDKIEERYLKYRYYYAGIDIYGFGDYGKAVYDPLLPRFDRWYSRKSLHDVPPNLDFLEERVYLVDHPDYSDERCVAVSFHLKVMALSMIGLIMNHNKDTIPQRLLRCIISGVSQRTKSYDYSECLCFSITVRMFIEMVKEDFSHFDSLVPGLTFADFANEETLISKPQPVISVL